MQYTKWLQELAVAVQIQEFSHKTEVIVKKFLYIKISFFPRGQGRLFSLMNFIVLNNKFEKK